MSISTPPSIPSGIACTAQQIQFRDLLKKVGSGAHTSKNLSREEAAIATDMMLRETASPIQIGAFMIAQRIKRPTPTELAGMLDTYDAMGPQLRTIESDYPVTVFSNPYDGRSRTAPINPLTALIMAAAGAPVVLHGSGRMPTKYGLPLIEILDGLGLHWSKLTTLAQVESVLQKTGFGFVYQAVQFPQAEAMVAYRDLIGKRPTLATVEIMWSPYAGACNLVSGYVHPPTEERTQKAFTERGTAFFTTVKGLEGSCDISRDRTAILGLNHLDNGELKTERLLLHPRDYGFDGSDPEMMPLEKLLDAYRETIAGKENEVSHSAVWNSGFYLWRVGQVTSIEKGFELAKKLLDSSAVEEKIDDIQSMISDII